MSLAIDSAEYSRLFQNGRGLSAQSPLPPGLFGYDADYENPFRKTDLDRARRLVAEAGYPDGIDPATGQPLRLTFDTPDTSAQGKLRFQWFANQWRKVGLDVRVEATNYNKFQDKVRNGAYQIFMWGWVADYPDPENFLFLLTSDMARSVNNGPNTANFQNAGFDRLFAGPGKGFPFELDVLELVFVLDAFKLDLEDGDLVDQLPRGNLDGNLDGYACGQPLAPFIGSGGRTLFYLFQIGLGTASRKFPSPKRPVIGKIN